MLIRSIDHDSVGVGTSDPLDKELPDLIAFKCPTAPSSSAYLQITQLIIEPRFTYGVKPCYRLCYFSQCILLSVLIIQTRMLMKIRGINRYHHWAVHILQLVLFICTIKLHIITVVLIIAVLPQPVNRYSLVILHFRYQKNRHISFRKNQKQYFLLHTPLSQRPSSDRRIREIYHCSFAIKILNFYLLILNKLHVHQWWVSSIGLLWIQVVSDLNCIRHLFLECDSFILEVGLVVFLLNIFNGHVKVVYQKLQLLKSYLSIPLTAA